MKAKRIFQSGRLLPVLASLVLAASLLALSLVLMVSLAHAQTGSISGTVTYYGGLTEAHDIFVCVNLHSEPHHPDVACGSAGPGGSYTIDGLADDTYYVYAWFDANDSGTSDWYDEPCWWYDPDGDGNPDPVVVTGGGAVAGIDIVLGGPWLPLGGPMAPDGQVNALAVHPDISGTLYAAVGLPSSGDATKVYVSTDGAASWTPVYTAPERLNALGVADTLVYGAGQGGYPAHLIVKSADSGAHWTCVFTGTEDYWNAFNALVINPLLTTTVYAAGYEEGPGGPAGVVYRSLDDGITWTPALTVPEGCCGVDFNALAVNPVIPRIVYAAGWESDASSSYAVIYRSLNNGATWTQVYSDTDPDGRLQFTSLAVHPLTPATVYAGSGWGPHYVYRSTDWGLSWTKVFTGAGFRLVFEPPDTIYAATDWGEVYSSTVGGDLGTWSYVSNAPGDIQSLAIDLAPMPRALYAGLDRQGVYKSINGGVDWEERNNGIETAVSPRDIDVDPQNLDKLFVAADYGGGWMSTNGGDTWSRPSGLPGIMLSFAINPGDFNIIYAGADEGCSGAVLRSEDGGLNFEPVYTSTVISPDCSGAVERIFALDIAPTMTSTVYAAGDHIQTDEGEYAVVVRGLNDGLNWTEVLTLPAESHVWVLTISPTDDETVYAGGEDCSGTSAPDCVGFVYRTTDGGSTWSLTLVSPGTVSSIVIDPQKPNVLYVSDDHYRVYKSPDGGDTWFTVREPWEMSGHLLAIDPHVPSHVYLGGGGYIAETTDGSLTWSEWEDPINQGTPPMEPQALTVDNSTLTQTLYAGFSGVWAYSRLAPQPSTPVTVTAWASAPSAPAGTTVTISSLVVDQNENWVADSTVVTFTTSLVGSFTSSAVTKTTTDGRASATLTGVMSGTATVTVTAGIGMDTLAVDFTPFKIYLPVVLKNF